MRRTLEYLIVRLTILVTICILLLLSPIAYRIFLHLAVRERVSFVVPGTQYEIEHSRIGTHPMLAEYDRDITFIVNDEEIVTSSMRIDTGGGYPINCYLIETSDGMFLWLVDAHVEHLIDLTNKTIHIIPPRMDDAYYQQSNPNDSSSGQWSRINDDPSPLGQTQSLTDLIDETNTHYLGRLDEKNRQLSFIPASEAPEVEIDRFFDR